MPRRPLTTCTEPGCPVRVARPGRCPAHRSALMRTYHRRPGRRSAMRAYDGTWRAIRRVVLAEEPTCRSCGAPSVDVDHIVPLSEGGTHARANLQGLCVRCHRSKTAHENLRAGGGFGRRG